MEYITNDKLTRGGLIITRTSLFIFVFLLFLPSLFANDTGFRFSKNYSYLEYDHQPQNWFMVQAENGLIYIANHGGVLEFDGVSWRLIEVPNYTVRSLAIGPGGTIFVGGKNEIGCLAPDKKGTLAYVSLCPHLEKEWRNFSNTWGTHAVGNYVLFDTSKFLFRWDPLKKEMIAVPRDYGAFLVCRGRMFTRDSNNGLSSVDRVDGNRLVTAPIQGGHIFSRVKIYTMFPYRGSGILNGILIGTGQHGLFLLEDDQIKPFPTTGDDFLKDFRIEHGVTLVSGDIALATRRGLVIISPSGELKYILDKRSGLQDDDVNYIFPDNRHNIWLCLDNGISKIEYHSPISVHDERSGLHGIAMSVARHRRDLYVGTNKGLYRLHAPLRFQAVPRMSESCWALASTGDSLWAATSAGVYRLTPNGPDRVIPGLTFELLPSRYFPGHIWCGTANGLVRFKTKDVEKILVQRFDTVTQPIRSMAEDKKGRLWIFTSTKGVMRLDFDTGGEKTVVAHYNKSHHLPEGQVFIASVAGHTTFATEKGLFKFDENRDVFTPDDTLGNEYMGGPDGKPVFRIVEGKDRNIWFHSQSRNYHAAPTPGSAYNSAYDIEYNIEGLPFLRIPIIQVNSIYPGPLGRTVWFAGAEGLIRYDTAMEKDYHPDFPTFIRRVRVNDDIVFDGYLDPRDHAAGGKNHLAFPVFPFSHRNIHFEFAAPYFEAENRTHYRCFLEGYDGDWPPWSKDAKRYYTNLEPGLYTFRVQAENVYRHLGREGLFRFEILPPWYRTWWAYLLYAAAALFAMFLVVKWRSRKLEFEKLKLEHIIKERIKEIKEKNLQLEKQSRQLKELDQAKSRLFANISHEFRTPLTLIISPIEEMLVQTTQRKQKKQLQVMLHNSQRVLTLINQLLDLSRFDSGTVKLHAAPRDVVPFVKGITASFQVLAQQNKQQLRFHALNETIPLYFDPQKLEEVMYNLLSNALKFTPEGGQITVTVSSEPGFCKMSVRDTGIGISKDQLGRIFDRFYQAEQPGQTVQKGTGIGLALIREIVTLHQGKIDVHSSEGKGTEFVVRFPLGNQHLQSSEILTETSSETPKESPEQTTSQRPNPAALYLPLNREPPTEHFDELDNGSDDEIHDESDDEGNGETKEKTEKQVILVVEDNADVRHYIRKALQPQYTVKEAPDGQQGIQAAKEIIPDLIVSDIMMPHADGYQLCKQLKNDVHTSHIPIILLTAKASEESIIRGLETGADDYVTKPFNTKMLISRIKNLIDLRRQLQLKIQRQKNLLPNEITVSSADETFLNQFQNIIKKNLADPDFDVNVLSEKLFMSRSTMFRKVQALTGETPNQFILTYRLETAAQLLKKRSGNITEIAMAVGFSSPAYFSRCFKEKYHQSPKAFQAAQT